MERSKFGRILCNYAVWVSHRDDFALELTKKSLGKMDHICPFLFLTDLNPFVRIVVIIKLLEVCAVKHL